MAVASSCQMYSGTGRVIFDWIRFARRYFDFSFLMDVANPHNFEMAREFCGREGIEFIPSLSQPAAGCPDTGFRGIELILQRPFDFVECVSWASSACNLAILQSLPPSTRLVFTPHTQPVDTIVHPARSSNVSTVFSEMTKRADIILLDSRAEFDLPLFKTCDAEKTFVCRLGVDTAHFSPPVFPAEERTIVSVADFRESRKRVDLVLDAFRQLDPVLSDLSLTLVGKSSETSTVPEGLDAHIRRAGYIAALDLREYYRKARLFVLFSDYEAFGLPIAEALACGCQVLVTRTTVLTEIFGGLPGVHFTDPRDTVATSEYMLRLCNDRFSREAISRAAANEFSFEKTYGRKLHALRELI